MQGKTVCAIMAIRRWKGSMLKNQRLRFWRNRRLKAWKKGVRRMDAEKVQGS